MFRPFCVWLARRLRSNMDHLPRSNSDKVRVCEVYHCRNYGYTLRRAKGRGAPGFIVYRNERADKAQTPSSEVEELSQ